MEDLPLSQKVVWRIKNFSTVNDQQLYSDTFSFQSLKWRILLVNPKYVEGYPHPTHMAIYLCPVDNTDSYFDYTLAVINQKDDLKTTKTEVKQEADPSSKAYSCGSFIKLSEFHNPNNGYLLDDTCIVEVEILKSKPKVLEEDLLFFAVASFVIMFSFISFVALGNSIGHPYKIPFYIGIILITSSFAVKLLNDFPERKSSAPLPAKVIELVSNVDQIKVSKAAPKKKHETERKNHEAGKVKLQGKGQLKVSEIDPAGVNLMDSPEVGLVKHPGAGQIFEGMIHNIQASRIDSEGFEEIGGFLVHKSHASLYKQIWLKYGHIASSHVLTAPSYLVQVMAVGDIMDSLLEMSCCRFIEVSSEMIGLWEGRIKTAENLQFNIGWLRKHFEGAKQGYDEMQELKTTVKEELQPIKASKARVTAAEDELKKMQAQLKEEISALASRVSPLTISESKFEMYLEKGDTLLFDGVF